jgi:hypothetical protein
MTTDQYLDVPLDAAAMLEAIHNHDRPVFDALCEATDDAGHWRSVASLLAGALVTALAIVGDQTPDQFVAQMRQRALNDQYRP